MNRETDIDEERSLCEYHGRCDCYKEALRRAGKGHSRGISELLLNSCGSPVGKRECEFYKRFERNEEKR